MHARHLLDMLAIMRHSSCSARPSRCKLLHCWGLLRTLRPNTSKFCSIGDVSGELAGHGNAFTPCCLRKSTVTRTRLGVGARCCPGTQSFDKCAGQMDQPLELKFYQRNVAWSSYLVRSFIPSFGCT